jgi:hypothetical protein
MDLSRIKRITRGEILYICDEPAPWQAVSRVPMHECMECLSSGGSFNALRSVPFYRLTDSRFSSGSGLAAFRSNSTTDTDSNSCASTRLRPLDSQLPTAFALSLSSLLPLSHIMTSQTRLPIGGVARRFVPGIATKSSGFRSSGLRPRSISSQCACKVFGVNEVGFCSLL